MLTKSYSSVITGAVLAALLSSPTFAAAGTKPVVAGLSTAAVAHIDWAHAESSPLWKQLGLSPSGSGEVTLYGTTFKSRWTNGTLYLESGDTPLCLPIIPKMKAELGSPVENDGSIVLPFSEKVSMKMVSLMNQWDIGTSRVNASCFGMANTPSLPDDPDKLNWTIAIGPKDKLAKLIPRFALTCTRTLTLSDGTSRPSTDMVMWVDTFMKHVTSPEGFVIADNGSFSATDSQISFSVTRNSIKSEYKIDRFTGSLSAAVIQDGNQGGTINGSCQKSDSLGQKF